MARATGLLQQFAQSRFLNRRLCQHHLHLRGHQQLLKIVVQPLRQSPLLALLGACQFGSQRPELLGPAFGLCRTLLDSLLDEAGAVLEEGVPEKF